MSQTRVTEPARALKKWAYLAFLIPALLPFAGYALGREVGSALLAALLTPLFVFAVVPLLDAMIGCDRHNPPEHAVPAMSRESYYRALTLSCTFLVPVLIVWGAWIFTTWDALGPGGRIGWAVSIGIANGVLAINAAHELIHRETRLERLAGGFLLALVSYAGFKIEHIRGHHRNVATPLDASTARYGQSLYAFVPQALMRNQINAWRLEAERLRCAGRAVIGPGNELLWWYGVTLLAAAGLTLALGWAGLAFFVMQSLVAASLLETVNYLEHYGLQRIRLPDGRYARTTHLHSWNSSYLLTNLLLFQLQRHSDHHAAPWRRYQVLRHHEESPQLPAGYATMVLLALIPPLWFRVMNRRVNAFRQAVAGNRTGH